MAQNPKPADTNLILSGQINLAPSVYVFAQSSTAFGIYYLNGSDWQLITSIPVSAVTVDSVHAKLSPNGANVAYMVTDGDTGNSALYTSNRFGIGITLVYSSVEPSMAVTSFAWRGDDQVAYTLKRGPFAAEASNGTAANPAEQAADSPYAGEVWLSSLDGIEQTQVVSQTAGLVIGSLDANAPIYYTAVNTQTETLIGLNSIAADGSIAELFRTQVDEQGQGTVYHSFDLVQTAPGVSKLAMVHTASAGDSPFMVASTLSTANLDGSNVQSVLNSDGLIQSAQWSPKGSKVAYVTAQAQLFTFDLATTSDTLVGSGVQSAIQWASDEVGIVTVAALDSATTPFVHGASMLALNGQELGTLSTNATIQSTRTQEFRIPSTVPFIHQVYDTMDNVGGYWSCGPTSAAMVLAYAGLLPARSDTVNPQSQMVNGRMIKGPVGQRTSPYGWYISEDFTNARGHRFNNPGNDSDSRWFYKQDIKGLHGAATRGGLASIEWIRANIMIPFGVDYFVPQNANLNTVVAALDRGNPVVIHSTNKGHLMVAVGYNRYSNGDVRLVVNDPFGREINGNYYTNGGYPNTEGSYIEYTWAQFPVTHMLEARVSERIIRPDQWRGEYYNNTNLSGTPALVRGDDAINFDWGSGSPQAGVVNADNFSVRWTREIDLHSHAVYRFSTFSDDGIRLFINDRPVLNRWDNHARLAVQTDVYLRAGKHKIRVEYYEAWGGATAIVNWWMAGSSPDNWTGSYFNNTTLSGDPVFLRQDPSINFNWGRGSPGSGVNSDNFSVRWTRSLYLPGGAWRFYTSSDDGSRVFLNNSSQPVVNQWWDHGARTEYSGYQYLNAGNHDVRVEFYERWGDASMAFGYQPKIWAEYYDQPNHRGTKRTAVLSSVDQNWWWGGPHSAWWQTQDRFSTRYTWPVNLAGGEYKICVDSDDGFRFFVDGQVKIDYWQDNNSQICRVVSINAGWRTFRIDHYENQGGARIRMTWGRNNGVWYGVAQPSLQNTDEVVYITDDQAALAIVTPATVNTMEEYFQLMHEQGTLGPGIEATEQSFTQIWLPLIQR
ncbi:PA14 domain-containing protein [Candidatus Chloroploca asiatica]|uniref:PA14 domain-containing protein n=1 Tax=Candidatus Chloroploca asiatica TaxID=1506545 RepID=UPI001559E256|nr:PA14 domain-containing protein [Candidatus Chloroploca asiatica]